jgi:hypothetical protein
METAAKGLLLLLLALMALQLFQGGPPQLKSWLKAKFLGSPT